MKLFTDNETDEVVRNVNMILATPKGSCPMNRDFGLDITFLDSPINKAKATMREDIAEQVEKYEKRAKIKEITFETDPGEGIIKPRLKLEIKV